MNVVQRKREKLVLVSLSHASAPSSLHSWISHCTTVERIILPPVSNISSGGRSQTSVRSTRLRIRWFETPLHGSENASSAKEARYACSTIFVPCREVSRRFYLRWDTMPREGLQWHMESAAGVIYWVHHQSAEWLEGREQQQRATRNCVYAREPVVNDFFYKKSTTCSPKKLLTIIFFCTS